ncbi:MAG TPA: DNA-processing protein DprA [Solirubrobacteraceae bacterium]|jgi:DNA processing protein
MTLDFKVRDLPRFWSLLELSDEQLIAAVGGRRCDELAKLYASFSPGEGDSEQEIATTCVHQQSYPKCLTKHELAPRALSVRGGIDRLAEMMERDVVAIVGARRASDYGMETARGLARGLATAGVTVAGALGEGIGAAVHAGALEASGPTLTVMAGGVGRCTPAWCGELYQRILREGCAISEMVDRSGSRPRRWWTAADNRTLALVAQLVIVVEAQEHPWELACANVAEIYGTPVAAVPGRVSSLVSAGTNALLMQGARLVRGPQDALDVLYGTGARMCSVHHVAGGRAELKPELARVLELVGNGHDTPSKLATRAGELGEIALALIELELEGLLVRGDGGRYIPCTRGAGARAVRECAPQSTAR